MLLFMGLVTSPTVIAAANDPSLAGSAQSLYQQGKQLLDSGQFEQAEQKLKAALKEDPTSLPAHLARGIALYNLNRYYLAADEFRVVLSSKTDSADAWLAAARNYQQMNKLDGSIDAYEHFIQLSPKLEGIEKYNTLLGMLKEQNEANKQTKNASGDTNANYFTDACKNNLFKWPSSRVPIKVYITNGEIIPGYHPVYDELLRESFAEWTEASKGKIAFEFVDKPEDATLTCKWTDNLHAPELKAEAGNANVTADGDGIDGATVNLLVVSPIKDQPMTDFLLHNVCLHEIGHALGLMGHSPYQDDIMFPSLLLQRGISQRDKNTLFLLYSNQQQKTQ